MLPNSASSDAFQRRLARGLDDDKFVPAEIDYFKPYLGNHPEFSAASGPQVSRRSAYGGSIGGEDIRDLRGGPVRVVGVVQQVTPGPAVEPA